MGRCLCEAAGEPVGAEGAAAVVVGLGPGEGDLEGGGEDVFGGVVVVVGGVPVGDGAEGEIKLPGGAERVGY